MEGPLLDDWYISITLTPPSFERGGRELVIRWNEPGPMPDQRRLYRLPRDHEAEETALVIAELLESYLVSRASALRRTIGRLERSGHLAL